MVAGLDELIESLLTEIAFSGVRGCSIDNLLAAIDSFYKASGKGTSQGNAPPLAQPRQDASKHDLAIASRVWRWLADRSDVSIGIDRKFNHVSLEDVLALPEEEEPELLGTAAQPPASTSIRKKVKPPQKPVPCAPSDESPTVRPRLHVSEERQWRTIAGHGPDLKRVPLFEWRALVDIASVKEKGILQGDLVRLTGQDKRSLPTRTDALAKKGYIIKQPIVLRGGKSSKLWLAQFSEHAKEHQDQEGLDYENIDLSKAALTIDLKPVPFCGKWNGETIDYLALAQGFVAIAKAWSLIRYCDARAKLGVEERVRQMRALAKTCRWLTNIGALSFVGAKFAGSNRLFKDCVKWMRDPSPAEWSHFRATPKTRMVVPSGRIGKRGEASRAVHASQKGGSRGSKAIVKKSQMTKPRTELLSHIKIVPSPWKPQKPVPNTAFEVVKRAGSKGTSNAAICRQTLGHNFRRLTAAMTGSISMPTNNQPPHLKHLGSASQLSRIGKTMTYTFYAVSEMPEAKPDEQHTASSKVDPALSLPNATDNATVSQQHPIFSQIGSDRFCKTSSSSLTDITQTHQPVPNFERRWKRKRSMHEEIDDQPPVKLPRRLGRPPKKKTIRQATPDSVEGDSQHEINDTPIVTQKQNIEDRPVESKTPPPAIRAPGVYRGLPNSLDPVIKRPGRRRKSLVIIFRSDKLKDPTYLRPQPLVADVNGTDGAIHAAGPDVSLREGPDDSQDIDMAETGTKGLTTQKFISKGTPAQPKIPKSVRKGSFLCEKCGNSWKNSNGLEYHLTKSRTTCNPDFVPPSTSSVLLTNEPRELSQAQVLGNKAKSPLRPEERRQLRHRSTPNKRIESKPTKKERPLSSSIPNPTSRTSALDNVHTSTPRARNPSDPRSPRGSIILKDLDVYNTAGHGRFPRQQPAHAGRAVSSSNNDIVVEGTQASNAHDSPSVNATLYADRPVNQTTVHRRQDKSDTTDYSLNVNTKHTEPATIQQNLSPRDPPSIRDTKRLEGNPSPSNSLDRTGTRKPLPSISHSKPGESDISTPTLTTRLQEAQISDTTPKTSTFPSSSTTLCNDGLAHVPSTHKSFESFVRPMKPNASFGARRRQRTIQIIEYLFDQNDGVFPGLRSLFMAVISVWVKEFKDLAPPDRRVCQNIVNQMERDNEIKQMHFFFFDDKGKMQECVVLVKADAMSGPVSDFTEDPRVIAVKDKMREMFPEAYVPDPFTLSPDEAKLFDQLASQGKEQGYSRLTLAKDLTKVQDIETLSYEDSVMDGISVRTNHTKRQLDEDKTQTPSKKPRIGVEQSDLPERARKPRRRPEKHEMWDSGKLAVYIWSQRQKPSAVWDQNHSCMQDPTTGTWSWAPDTEPSQGNISTILSSVKSARHIDATLEPKVRKKYKKRAPRSSMKPPSGVEAGREASFSMGRIISIDDRNDSNDATAEEGFLSDEDTESFYEGSSDLSDNENTHLSTSYTQFASTTSQSENIRRQRPGLSSFSWETRDTNTSTDTRLVSNIPGPSISDMPRSLQDIFSTVRRVHSFKKWADPIYGEFLRDVKTIRSWEQSPNEPHRATHGPDAHSRVYISLVLNSSKANMKPIRPEWLASNQFTVENIPNEIKDLPRKDAEYGLAYGTIRNRTSESNKKSKHKAAAANDGRKPRNSSQKASEQVPHVMAQPSIIPTPLLEYKTRDLTSIPKQPRGRVNKPAAHDDKLGSKREDELVAACVVFRSLLGGLDRNLDIGLLLKHFPGMSLSALKKFWPRVSRERKTYVQALTAKFHSGFIKAYESGELPSLDYDNLENYDWKRLILWTTQLETHEEVDLPESRQTLYQNNIVEDVTSEAADWRETWFATTSTYNRIEAVASETMSIPLPSKSKQDMAIIERARTWVRSICCTSLRGVNAKERLVPRLLELGDGDAAETNRILEKVVKQLNKDRVITRTKGKDIGGNFRIHGMFSKQLEKMASTVKVRQAFTFKVQLDEAFRRCNEYIMPYASDDGLIMAVLNLQAHGRIRVEALDMPNIPFGFEPGNYEGRTFPKSYYHFRARLSPTDTYLYNEDMALLGQAQDMKPPTQGPDGKIPIWVDFFGNANVARWADFVSMIVFTLALKGPVVPKMCVAMLKPMVEEFEVALIVEWLGNLGLIQQVTDDCGVTAAEWWWLVAGCIAQPSDE